MLKIGISAGPDMALISLCRPDGLLLGLQAYAKPNLKREKNNANVNPRVKIDDIHSDLRSNSNPFISAYWILSPKRNGSVSTINSAIRKTANRMIKAVFNFIIDI